MIDKAAEGLSKAKRQIGKALDNGEITDEVEDSTIS